MLLSAALQRLLQHVTHGVVDAYRIQCSFLFYTLLVQRHSPCFGLLPPPNLLQLEAALASYFPFFEFVLANRIYLQDCGKVSPWCRTNCQPGHDSIMPLLSCVLILPAAESAANTQTSHFLPRCCCTCGLQLICFKTAEPVSKIVPCRLCPPQLLCECSQLPARTLRRCCGLYSWWPLGHGRAHELQARLGGPHLSTVYLLLQV